MSLISENEHEKLHYEDMSLEQIMEARESLLRPMAEKIIDAQQPLRERYVAVMKEIKFFASEYGMTEEKYLSMSRSQVISHVVSELKRREAAVVTTRTPGHIIPKKYHHPNNHELQWAGRGARPRWVTEFLRENPSMSLEDMKIPEQGRR
ncbi:MAG: hypothetical protein DDT34_02217 [Firmicutes bacterium]|nr:hypothetical protein [Bacillota bacterium]MBT9165373.1 hypothetical protein [Chloroflexota bacterium]